MRRSMKSWHPFSLYINRYDKHDRDILVDHTFILATYYSVEHKKLVNQHIISFEPCILGREQEIVDALMNFLHKYKIPEKNVVSITKLCQTFLKVLANLPL